jgi:hypothetical protein
MKVKKILSKVSYESLYYLCGGYDYRLENGIFTNCEPGRFDGVRGEVIKKLFQDTTNYVNLNSDELKCYVGWIGEAVSIKGDHMVEENPTEYDWTIKDQNKLVKYYNYLLSIQS